MNPAKTVLSGNELHRICFLGNFLNPRGQQLSMAALLTSNPLYSRKNGTLEKGDCIAEAPFSIPGEAGIYDIAENGAKGIAQPDLGIIAVASSQLLAAQQNFLIRSPAFDQR